MEKVFARQLMAFACFFVFDANHTISNSKFSKMYHLIWFYQISSIYDLKWLNSEFSEGNVQMFLYSERYDLSNFSFAVLENCKFFHITSLAEFMFKWLSTSVFFSNSYFENLTLLQPTARAWLKGEEGDMFIENCTFLNCGFKQNSSTAPKIFDKSLLNPWFGFKNKITDSTFKITDDSCYLIGGFINTYTSFTSFTMINSTFKVSNENPDGGFKGVVVFNVPNIEIRDCKFLNLKCALRETNILQENGGGLFILGSPAYTPAITSLKVNIL